MDEHERVEETARSGYGGGLLAGAVSSPGASSSRLACLTTLRSATGVSKPRRSILRPRQRGASQRSWSTTVMWSRPVRSSLRWIPKRLRLSCVRRKPRSGRHSRPRPPPPPSWPNARVRRPRLLHRGPAREREGHRRRRRGPTRERTGIGRQGIDPFTATGLQRRGLTAAVRHRLHQV